MIVVAGDDLAVWFMVGDEVRASARVQVAAAPDPW